MFYFAWYRNNAPVIPDQEIGTSCPQAIMLNVPQNQRQHQHPHGMRPVDSRHRRNQPHHRGQEEYEQPEEPRESIGHGHQKEQPPRQSSR